ncbi:MAG TPA: zf-HC2 domain-containing protein [Tepidisphaeraceae bacterium]|jgi:anti-sigma factor RsiW
MDTCQYENELDAYHDGELSDQRRVAFEQHLAACPLCASELEQMRRLTSLISSAPKRTLPAAARDDLYALAPAVGEGVYLRIAEWTTALAASVLIAASVWLFYSQPAQQGSEALASLSPVILNPPQMHDASEMPDDPQLIDWVTVNASAGQNQ